MAEGFSALILFKTKKGRKFSAPTHLHGLKLKFR